MYHSHWGLQSSPFRGYRSPRSFYQSPTHEEGLARLHFLTEQNRRLGLLMGDPGSGKSLLLSVFAEQLRREGRSVATVSLLGLQPTEMLYLLSCELKLSLEPTDSIARLWQAVTNRLAEFRYQQTPTILLFDDVDRADSQILDQVIRLVQHDSSPASRLTIVIAGRRDAIGHIGRRLLELVELRIDVEPWEQSDTEAFIESSLAEADRESPIFDRPAVARLHELSHGVPRRVSQLADLALLAGAGQDLRQIDADVVESAYRELGTVEV